MNPEQLKEFEIEMGPLLEDWNRYTEKTDKWGELADSQVFYKSRHLPARIYIYPSFLKRKEYGLRIYKPRDYRVDAIAIEKFLKEKNIEYIPHELGGISHGGGRDFFDFRLSKEGLKTFLRNPEFIINEILKITKANTRKKRKENIQKELAKGGPYHHCGDYPPGVHSMDLEVYHGTGTRYTGDSLEDPEQLILKHLNWADNLEDIPLGKHAEYGFSSISTTCDKKVAEKFAEKYRIGFIFTFQLKTDKLYSPLNQVDIRGVKKLSPSPDAVYIPLGFQNFYEHEIAVLDPKALRLKTVEYFIEGKPIKHSLTPENVKIISDQLKRKVIDLKLEKLNYQNQLNKIQDEVDKKLKKPNLIQDIILKLDTEALNRDHSLKSLIIFDLNEEFPDWESLNNPAKEPIHKYIKYFNTFINRELVPKYPKLNLQDRQPGNPKEIIMSVEAIEHTDDLIKFVKETLFEGEKLQQMLDWEKEKENGNSVVASLNKIAKYLKRK